MSVSYNALKNFKNRFPEKFFTFYQRHFMQVTFDIDPNVEHRQSSWMSKAASTLEQKCARGRRMRGMRSNADL